MKLMSLFIISLALLFTGCTDADIGKLSAFNGSASVKCYSGNILIYEGESTGKVSNPEGSDGYYFVDKKDNLLKEVSGNCIITYREY
jgi:hypothetical protein